MSKKYVLVEATATFKMKYSVPVDDINLGGSNYDIRRYAEDLVSKERVTDICQEYMGDTITNSAIIAEDDLIEIYKEQFKINTLRTKEDILKIINSWEIN
jgi:hypothetical protein